MRAFRRVFAAAAAAMLGAAAAQPAPSTLEGPPPDEILVAEEREGPSFWRVHDADTEIFVLPSVTFLPEDFVWNDRGVARLLERADEVLTPVRVDAGAGDMARFMGAMLRTMTVSRGRLFMPKDETLATHVGADLAQAYDVALARAEARKDARKKSNKQAGKQESAEVGDDGLADVDDATAARALEDVDPTRTHPFIQANRLWSAAVDSAGLKSFRVVEKRVSRLADRADVKVRALAEKNLAFSDAKKLLTSMRDFSPQTDSTCIAASIDFAERRLGRTHRLAEAWARGDARALADAAEPPRESACALAISSELGGLSTFGGATLAEILGSDLVAAAIEDSLQKPGVRLAIVSSDGWLSKGGAMDALRARGIAVDDPPTMRRAAADDPALVE